MKNKKIYAISIAIAILVGALSALLTMNGMMHYDSLKQPFLSPPAFIFPIVWTILFTLMGISSAKVYLSSSPHRNSALIIYAAQLIANFFWTILFFGFELRGFAFIWILVLIGLVIAMILSFNKVSKSAAYLQIPYLIWLIFAAYLNYFSYYLNIA